MQRPPGFEYAPEIDQFADHLASLTAEASKYLEFIRLTQSINLDPDVRRISKLKHIVC